uniref:C-type lectin domain family 2 member L-like n=1 Tax=Geotrypetes seraphini TaxID=260995 RepID=A0A6P8QDH2_GEOSA|nr:C-type lectin domain family 2 member L-like [Geotrypetes seraphini]
MAKHVARHHSCPPPATSTIKDVQMCSRSHSDPLLPGSHGQGFNVPQGNPCCWAPSRKFGRFFPTRCWSQTRVWKIIFLVLCLTFVFVYLSFTWLKACDTDPFTEPCPEGWSYFMKTCHYFNKSELSWNTSQDHCGSHNASLAVFPSEKELDYLFTICKNDCWIDLRKKAGTYQWTNGTPYHNLFEILNNEECVYIKDHKVLSTPDCLLPRAFICTMGRKSSGTII